MIPAAPRMKKRPPRIGRARWYQNAAAHAHGEAMGAIERGDNECAVKHQADAAFMHRLATECMRPDDWSGA